MKKILGIIICVWLSILWSDQTISTSEQANTFTLSADEIITFAPGEYLLTRSLPVADGVTYRAENPATVTINGGHSGDIYDPSGVRIFEDASAITSTINIQNLTVIKGNALYSASDDVIVGGVTLRGKWFASNCSFGGNVSAVWGGVAYQGTWTAINCTFSDNVALAAGGVAHNGIWNVTNCTFTNNTARSSGTGGCVAYGGTWIANNCKFNGNVSYANNASKVCFSGGTSNLNSNWAFTNCIFSGHYYIAIGYATMTAINCTFSDNYFIDSGVAFTGKNSIFWGNNLLFMYSSADITFSDVQGGRAGLGNINSDPKFTGAAEGDFRLLGSSPCIDTGTSSGAPATDIVGAVRPVGSGIDMGAYEGSFTGAPYVFVPADVSNQIVYRRRNISTLAEIARIEVNQVSLNLGTLTEANNFTDKTIIDVLPEGKPYIQMTSADSLVAAAVNNSNGVLWVTASFTVPEDNRAIVLNGEQLTDDEGNLFPKAIGKLSNVNYENGTLTFRIHHFSTWSIPQLVSKNFIGSAEGLVVTANGVDIKVVAGSFNSDGTGNDTFTAVAKISGLAYETTLNDVQLVGDIYKPMNPADTDYSVHFGYINRGNAADDFLLTTSMVSENAGHFGYVITEDAKNVAAWQIVSFNVDVNNSGAKAFERATLNAAISIENEVAVSYNAFPGAVSTTFGDDGVYGGVDDLSYSFTFETEGYSLKVLNRVATINSPLSDGQLIPGSKIKYEVVIKNESSAVATDVRIKDVIPANTHLYYIDGDIDNNNVIGAVLGSWSILSITNNAAAEVEYQMTIPANGIVTASYTVTVD